MKAVIFVFYGLFLVAVSSQAPPPSHNPGTQPPSRCCIPGKEIELTYDSNVATGSSYYRQRVRGAFNFTGRQYGSISDVVYINGTTIRVRIIILAAENTQYYIFNGTCTKLQNAFVEPQRCISEDYNYVDSFSIGAGEVEGYAWTTVVNDSKHGIYGTNDLSFSAESCIPIGQSSLVYLGVPPNLASVSDSGVYTNYTDGIADPDFWFKPPSFCPPITARARRSAEVPLRHYLLSKIAMLGSWSPY